MSKTQAVPPPAEPTPSRVENYRTTVGLPLAEAFGGLDAELEARAYKEIRGGKGQKLGLTDIAPAYLPDYLNKAFGPIGFGWGFNVENLVSTGEQVERSAGYTDTEWMARCDVRPWYRVVDVDGPGGSGNELVFYLPNCPGASKNSMREWAEKGAVTNALGTSWFFAGWQMAVYKGQRSHTDFKNDKGGAGDAGPYASSSAIDDDFAEPGKKAEAAKVKAASPQKQEAKAAAPKAATPKSEPTAAASPAEPIADGYYVVPFGMHRGKKVMDIDESKLAETVAWAKKNNKYAEFVTAAERYMKHSGLPFGAPDPAPAVRQESVTAADKPEPKAQGPQQSEATPEELEMEKRTKWVNLCLLQIEGFAKKDNREKAKEWAETAVKKAKEGEITQFQLDMIGTEYRRHFPNKIEGKQEDLPLESKPASKPAEAPATRGKYAEIEAQVKTASRPAEKNKIVRLIMETFKAQELTDEEKNVLLASLKGRA